MHRLLVLLLVLALPAVFINSCGGGGKCPSGSECKNVTCSCTDVVCDLYTGNIIKITYLLKDGQIITKYTAILSIDINGLDPVEGHEFTGAEMLQKDTVTLNNPDNNWINFTADSHCKIDTFGGANGQLQGDCTFVFHHAGTGDFNAYMPFNCTLDPVTL